MEVRVEVAGARLDKAVSELTELSRGLANEQIKEGKNPSSMVKSKRPNIP